MFLTVLFRLPAVSRIHNVITVCNQMQDKVSSVNLALTYVRSSEIHVWSTKLDHAKPDHSEPDYVEPNQGLHCQIIMWDLCSTGILCCIEWQFLSDVLEQPISPSSNIKEIQREKTAGLKLTDSLLFLGLYTLSNFLRKHNVLEACSISIYRERSN
jgi:hypothetical protein